MKIFVLTATRAEYGLLKPLLNKMMTKENFEVEIIVTGAHLSYEFGMTYQEIEEDGFFIHKKIEILLSSDTPNAISKSMGLAMISFADFFSSERPDALLVLGDRYETLAVCIAAMNERIPIIHLYGGETTEGAVDEQIRHAITKMSYLHLTSIEAYRKRIIQLGEEPERVFCVGALGLENIATEKLMSKEELEESLGINLSRRYAVFTFHPVTLEEDTAQDECKEILKALETYCDLTVIFTMANADVQGRKINQLLMEYVEKHRNAVFVNSLGMRRYLSAVKNAAFVIGNSSSGILEVPSFGIPTINIGDRQKGRIQAKSIINCQPDERSVCKAIDKALSKDFLKKIKNVKNPYGDGKASEKIVNAIEQVFLKREIDLKKKFYNISF